MVTHLLLVAFGGATGAVARYGIGLWVAGQDNLENYWATLVVNVIGSGVMGALAAWLLYRGTLAEQALWLFFGVGVLGAFTTFSSFSKETVDLMLAGEAVRALVYAASNLVLSTAAFACAFLSFRSLVS